MNRVGECALEIGYWLRPDATGQGLATMATSALTTAAFDELGVDRVVIKHDAANTASGPVPARLGYTHTHSEELEIEAPGECGTTYTWTMWRDDWTPPER